MRSTARLAAIIILAAAVLGPAAASAAAASALAPPTLTAGFDQMTAQALGATLSFTITQSGTGTNAASEFVWGLDTPPPAAGAIPAGQTCKTTAATSACTKISGGKATLTISVPSPGSHNLWVYEKNAAGADSAVTNGAPAGQGWTFSGDGDARTVFTAGASLAANFAAAVAGEGTTMISASSGTSCGAASGDGTGTDFDAADWTGAGWDAGKTVTVDGASFAVPAFGGCGKDSLLSADQEIGAGAAGGHGSALVFLATSTSAQIPVPGLMTGSPDSGALVSDVTWGDQTIRIAASPNISAPAGTSDLRIRLENPGFTSRTGPGPLIIGAASVAPARDGAVPAQAPVPLTFAGSGPVSIPVGGDVYSDPLTLPFAVTAGKDLLISLWLKNASLPALPENTWASGAGTWFAPATVPNQTGDATGTPFTGPGSSWTGSVAVLTGVDLTTPAATLSGQQSPGAPTVVVAGDNVTDGGTAQPISDARDAPSQRLAGQLASQGLAPGYGVVDAGIESNQVLSDGTGHGDGGVALMSRADRDILAEPDVGTVIIDEGLEDLLRDSASTIAPNLIAGNLVNAYQALADQLQAFGVNVIIGTLTPCAGHLNSAAGDACTTSVDTQRQQVNTAIIQDTPLPACSVNFDAAVSNGASPEALQPADNAGDDVNLTLTGSGSGYAALAPAVFSSPDACSLLPNQNPLPAVP